MVKANFSLDVPEIDWQVVDLFSDRAALEKELDDFVHLYEKRPFDNTGGITFGSAFAYYFFLKRISPGVVIESGIWRGFSTWLIESMLPSASLICLDPVLMMPLDLGLVYRSPRAHYNTHDFSCFGFPGEIAAQACVVFDDHQNVSPRLEQAMNYGIQHVILDDNQYEDTYHESITHLIKHNHPVLPYLFNAIDEYYLFPPLISPTPDGCPVEPLWNEIPSVLQHLNHEQEFAYTWVTYIRLKA